MSFRVRSADGIAHATADDGTIEMSIVHVI